MNETPLASTAELGQLVRGAREQRQRSLEDCSKAVGIRPERYAQIETGTRAPTLPELEVLAMYLDVPMGYFWETVKLEKELPHDYEGYMALRHVIIGTAIRQFRDDNKMTFEELVKRVGISAVTMREYESGRPIPITDLRKVLTVLDHTLGELTDDERGPLAQHETGLMEQLLFEQLPKDLRAFVVEPANKNYLELAVRLSRLDADALRTIAESLLEITY